MFVVERSFVQTGSYTEALGGIQIKASALIEAGASVGGWTGARGLVDPSRLFSSDP